MAQIGKTSQSKKESMHIVQFNSLWVKTLEQTPIVIDKKYRQESQLWKELRKNLIWMTLILTGVKEKEFLFYSS